MEIDTTKMLEYYLIGFIIYLTLLFIYLMFMWMYAICWHPRLYNAVIPLVLGVFWPLTVLVVLSMGLIMGYELLFNKFQELRK